MEEIKKTGFYIIDEQFFLDMKEPYLKGNKGENRPHYYCFKDDKLGVYWMIPLSSKIDKYKKIMEKKINNNKPCDIIHITKLDNGYLSVFLIQDIFPITKEYVKREYTINGKHLLLTSEHDIKTIEHKAKKVIGMLKRGIKFMPTQVNIPLILDKLKK